MKTKSLIKGMVAVVATVTGLAVFGSAMAYPAQGYRIRYFSDGTFTTHVGTAVMVCNGHRSMNGVTSDYSQAEFEDCSNGVPAGELPCAMGVESDVCHYYPFFYWPEWNANPPL